MVQARRLGNRPLFAGPSYTWNGDRAAALAFPGKPRCRTPRHPPRSASTTCSRRRASAARARGLPYAGAVTPDEALALLEGLPGARLIDVRTRAEWDYVGRVPGSVLIEWNTYPSGTRNAAFVQQLAQVAGAPDVPLLFLCRSGQRSDHAARAAHAAGYQRAFNVIGRLRGRQGRVRPARSLSTAGATPAFPGLRDRTDRPGSPPAWSRWRR